MSSFKWVCKRCAERESIIIDNTMTQYRECSVCKIKNWCTSFSGKVPKKRKKKKPSAYHPKTLRLPKATFKELEKEAKKVGCSVHSLILNYIRTGLHPPLVAVSSGYIPQPPAQRPPVVGLPPSRKKGEKDPLVAEIEKHPMFIRMKKRYNKEEGEEG